MPAAPPVIPPEIGPENRTPARRRVLWAPFPGMQEEALIATEDEVLIGGAKGPGKTDVLLMGAIRQMGMDRYRAYISRETGPQLQEIIDRSHRIFTRLPSKPAWNGSERRWRFPNDTFLQFEAIGTPEEAARIQGKEPSYFGQDEVGNIPDERTVDLIQSEIRCPNPLVRTGWRGSANPGKAGHAWLKRRFVDKCGIDGKTIYARRVKLPNGTTTVLTRRYIPGTVQDNPVYANNPRYMAQLMTLPETLRRQLLFGDWNAGSGMALDELSRAVHMMQPFDLPRGWFHFGAFDWGFAHNWCFPWGAVDEDGSVYVADTVWGRRQLVHEIAERVNARVPVERLRHIHTDSAAFQRNRSRQENPPTVAEELMQYGIIVTQGNTDRRAGLNNIRHYLAYKGLLPSGRDADPMVRFMDTPGNRKLFDQLEQMTLDPDDPEDVLKVHADSETGEGGDDGYDAFRLLMASRPARAIGEFFRGKVGAFSPETLAFMREKLYRDEPDIGTRSMSGAAYITSGSL